MHAILRRPHRRPWRLATVAGWIGDRRGLRPRPRTQRLGKSVAYLVCAQLKPWGLNGSGAGLYWVAQGLRSLDAERWQLLLK